MQILFLFNTSEEAIFLSLTNFLKKSTVIYFHKHEFIQNFDDVFCCRHIKYWLFNTIFFAAVEIFQWRIPLIKADGATKKLFVISHIYCIDDMQLVYPWKKKHKIFRCVKCKFDWLCLLSTVRVHSITMRTKFWPILTLSPPRVDNCEYFTIYLIFTLFPPSSCLRSYWRSPYCIVEHWPSQAQTSLQWI